jgi:hypothetical protein
MLEGTASVGLRLHCGMRRLNHSHTHTHTHTHARTHTHTHTLMNQFTRRLTHIHTLTPSHLPTHSHILTYNTCTHTYIHTHTHTYIHTYTHTYIHTYIHTFIHKYIHTYIIHNTYIHAHSHTYQVSHPYKTTDKTYIHVSSSNNFQKVPHKNSLTFNTSVVDQAYCKLLTPNATTANTH